jgi:uncharacterized protein (TIGR02996 family)
MPAPDAPLLARILAAPDDDAARRAYADHLRAAGDPLGELLKIPCTLATGARAVARSPVLARLRKLALYGHQIGADGLLALVTSPRLGLLDGLAVHSAKIDAKGVAAAIAEPAFARLKALELYQLPLTASGPTGCEAQPG